MKHTFNGDGISADFVLEPGESVGYAVSGTFAGRIDIDEYRHNSWQVRESGLVNQGLSWPGSRNKGISPPARDPGGID